MLKSSIALLLILSIATTLALDTNLQGNYFYVSSENYLSYELYQTRNGILGFSIEKVNQTDPASKYISQYTLIDLPNKDAKPILADLVRICEYVAPTFQNLHYHAQTDTVSYFCWANNSLLLIDQSNYQVETVIPFNISGSWPVVKLSTEGMGIAVLLMGDLFTTNPRASLLVKVDLQTRAVTDEIYLNKDFGIGEAVVAYASSKKAAFIATNRIQGSSLATTVYSIVTIGKQYQITSLTTVSAPLAPIKIVTKLFCFDNHAVVTSGQDVYFINQKGIYQNVPNVSHKSLTWDPLGLFHLGVTAQYEGIDLYIQAEDDRVYHYQVLGDELYYRILGGYGDMQIAYGKTQVDDLIFTHDYIGVVFTIYQITTMNQVYSAVAGYEDLMLTNSTYAVVQSHASMEYYLFIFNLKTNVLINSLQIPQEYYYTKEQHIISYFINPYQNCTLAHVDLITGKTWNSTNISSASQICQSSIIKLRITENGHPELVVKFLSNIIVLSETYGELTFKPTTFPIISDFNTVNINFDDLSFNFLDSDQSGNKTNVTSYAYNPKSKRFEYKDSNLIQNLSANRFINIDTNQTLIVSNNSLAVINGIGKSPERYVFPQDWNYASAFQDSTGNEYIILTKSDLFFVRGAAPALLASGNIATLPGSRKDSVRAKAAGVNSYWVGDAFYASIGLVRFYNADSSKINGGKAMISL